MHRLIVSLLLFLFAPLAAAVAPTPGLWWNPAESGRGFDIGYQNDTMVMTTYIYDTAGNPLWFISVGHFNFQTGVYDATFDTAHGGQCLGCAYTPSTGVPAAGGAVKITFTSATTATIAYHDAAGIARTIPIQHFDYAFSNANDKLYGAWSLTLNVAGLVDGKWIDLTTPYSTNDVDYVAGHLDGIASDVALGNYDATTGNWYVLVKVGNFYDFYRFTADDRRWIGVGWIYPVGGSPVGNGSPIFAARLAWKNELAALGITMKRDGRATAEDDARSAQLVAAQAKSSGAPIASDDAIRLAMTRELERQSPASAD